MLQIIVLHIVITCITSDTELSCVTGCLCNGSHMACDAHVPSVIPDTVTNVNIYGADISLYKMTSSWRNVTRLSILPDQTIDGQHRKPQRIKIPARAFANLRNLQHLKISSSRLRDMESKAFCGLEALEVLDLSDNFHLNLSEIIQGMKGCTFANLHTFSVRYLSKLSPSKPEFDSDFFNLFNGSVLRSLDMSYINGGVIIPYKMGRTATEIECLNLEKSRTLSMIFMYYFHYFHHYLAENNTHFMPKLKELNLNYAGGLNAHYALFILAFHVPCCKVLFPTLKKIHASRIVFPDNFDSVDIRVMEINGSVKVSFIFYRFSNEIFTFSIPYPATVEYVDLSNNYIGHIFVNVTKESNLKSINISHNNLRSLEVLVNSVNFPKLQELVATHNGLAGNTTIYFRHKTPELEYLDLSHNELTDFVVSVFDIPKLKLLNLSYNKIHVLSESAMETLTFYFEERSKKYMQNTTEINNQIILTGNPFRCSCDSLSFLEWLTLDLTNSFIGTATCASDSSDITKDRFRDVKESCMVNTDGTLIVGLAVGGLVIVLALTAGFVLRKHCIKIKRRFEIKRRLDQYRALPARSIPVFLSYSSKNEDFVQRRVFPELNSRPQRKLETGNDCVTFGDKSFRAGRPLLSEIIRCIEEATVIVFCVSKDFCESPWCKDEVFVAHCEMKPIVLMFLEQVPVKTMPKTLQKLYMCQGRSKWTLNDNGEYILTPNWDTFCDSLCEIIVDNTPL